MNEVKFIEVRLKKLGKLQGEFEEYEKELKRTFINDSRMNIRCLKNIQNITIKIDKIEEEIMEKVLTKFYLQKLSLSRQLNSLKEEANKAILESFKKFKELAEELRIRMLSSGIRDKEYNTLLQSLRGFGVKIGEHEEIANKSLKIKEFKNLVSCCKFVNKKIIKYNYLFATQN